MKTKILKALAVLFLLCVGIMPTWAENFIYPSQNGIILHITDGAEILRDGDFAWHEQSTAYISIIDEATNVVVGTGEYTGVGVINIPYESPGGGHTYKVKLAINDPASTDSLLASHKEQLLNLEHWRSNPAFGIAWTTPRPGVIEFETPKKPVVNVNEGEVTLVFNEPTLTVLNVSSKRKTLTHVRSEDIRSLALVALDPLTGQSQQLGENQLNVDEKGNLFIKFSETIPHGRSFRVNVTLNEIESGASRPMVGILDLSQFVVNGNATIQKTGMALPFNQITVH